MNAADLNLLTAWLERSARKSDQLGFTEEAERFLFAANACREWWRKNGRHLSASPVTEDAGSTARNDDDSMRDGPR